MTAALSIISCDATTNGDQSGGDYGDCAARVRREYKVPPGNINAQNQMIQQECGMNK